MSTSRQFPDVDYLTRDYEGFRQLLVSLLDRSGTPWSERAAADVGMTLVEILAHELDLLSYAGDRVAQESFLATARRRESVRRHAMLGGYKLDRGCATTGYQSFELRDGHRKRLTEALCLSPALAIGEDPEQRLIAQTTEAAELDYRRNHFVLERSAVAGSAILHLSTTDGFGADLRKRGLCSGTKLAILDAPMGELVTVRSVQGNAIELDAPLQRTYLAGEDSPVVIKGNLVGIRLGRGSGWVPCGKGGASLEEIGVGKYCLGQLEELRALRAEVENLREVWQRDETLRERWLLANQTADLMTRKLRTTSTAALGRNDAERLTVAADLFREMILACGSYVPNDLQRSERVDLAHQCLRLPGELPTLWLDEVPTLSVKVGVAGVWSDWTEVEDLLASHADDRHYVVEVDDAGYVTLLFGNGTNGARLPADSQVMVNHVVGELDVGNLGARSLSVIVNDEGDEFVPDATMNPFATQGWRAAEPLSGVAARIAEAQSRPLIPVTVADYESLLNERTDVLESAVWVSKPARLQPDGSSADNTVSTTRVLPASDVSATIARAERNCVHVVIRPAAEQDPALVLRAVRAYLNNARLCGTVVSVSMSEHLYVSVRIIVEVHPEIAIADLRLRLRRALLDLFGPDRDHVLGRARSCAEVYAAVETVPGVLWSQVVGFDRAAQGEIAVREAIQPARHQIIRCLDIPGNRLTGEITVWVARRYRLELQLAYSDPDARPSTAQLVDTIKERLSGPNSLPVIEQWPGITIADVDRVLDGMLLPEQKYRLSTLSLVSEQRKIERLQLDRGDVPVLDYIQIRDERLSAHYRLELEITSSHQLPNERRLRERFFQLLSGPQSIPAIERWPEVTAGALQELLQRDEVGGAWKLQTRVLAMIASQENVHRLSLACDQVPILDALHLAMRRAT